MGKVSICWWLFSKTASEKHLWHIFKWNKIFFEISVDFTHQDTWLDHEKCPVTIVLSHLFYLFHRIRRTQSGSLPADGSDSDFKRGGFRATAGPRLACLGIGSSARYPLTYTSDTYANTFIPVSHILHLFSAVTWTLPSRNGHVIRCVHGWRTLAWVSTCKWPDSGWLAVRLYYLPPRRTWRRWDTRFIQHIWDE